MAAVTATVHYKASRNIRSSTSATSTNHRSPTMAQTIRKYWGPLQPGRISLNYNWAAINQDSVVLVSASEFSIQNPPSDEYRFLGGASITVENVVPHGPPYDPNHGVTFIVNVTWGSAINVVTDITVLASAPVEVDFYTPPK